MAKGLWGFSKAGKELARLHIDCEELEPHGLRFLGDGDVPLWYRVEAKMGVSKDHRSLSVDGSLALGGMSPQVWNFRIGGYQVCEKWLKDRRGRTLSYDDLEHYRKIVTALTETVRLTAEIDAAIPEWPIE